MLTHFTDHDKKKQTNKLLAYEKWDEVIVYNTCHWNRILWKSVHGHAPSLFSQSLILRFAYDTVCVLI